MEMSGFPKYEYPNYMKIYQISNIRTSCSYLKYIHEKKNHSNHPAITTITNAPLLLQHGATCVSHGLRTKGMFARVLTDEVVYRLMVAVCGNG